jgi:hypothetical protein
MNSIEWANLLVASFCVLLMVVIVIGVVFCHEPARPEGVQRVPVDDVREILAEAFLCEPENVRFVCRDSRLVEVWVELIEEDDK